MATPTIFKRLKSSAPPIPLSKRLNEVNSLVPWWSPVGGGGGFWGGVSGFVGGGFPPPPPPLPPPRKAFRQPGTSPPLDVELSCLRS